MSDDAASVPADVSSGDKIAGYRLEEQIGQGGMAVVYRAHDERLDRRVALKLLAPALATDTAFRTRFIRESRAAAAVDHPNIIPVYDAGDAGGFLFISMRYVQGGDVRSLLADGNPVAPARAWAIISQVAAALDAAHEHGLVHRDVKPANMLLDAGSRTNAPRGGDLPDHVYLSDFGISKRTLASNLTSTGQFVGTLDYIAPEQIEGQAIDGRTDQYSLACAAFELLSGVPPFRRSLGLALINAHLSEPPPSLTARRSGLAPSVDIVLAKAMAKSPAQRYATCEAFAMDLGRALGRVDGALEAGASPPVGTVADGGGPARAWPATALAEPVLAPAAAGGAPPPGPALAATTPPTQWPGAESGGGAGSGAAGAGAGVGVGVAGAVDPATMLAQPRSPAAPGGAAGTRPGDQGYPYGTNQNFPAGSAPGWQGGAGGSGGQGWPQYQQQQPPQRRRSRGMIAGVLIATIALAVAAAAIAFVVLNNKNNNGNGNGQHSSSPPPRSSAPPTASVAQTQANAIGNLLTTSEQTRGQLGPAVNDIEGNCSASFSNGQLATDVQTIKTVAMQRQTEYKRALTLRTSALANGATLRTDLLNALQFSLNADNDYLQWAQQEQAGCFPASESAAFNAAGSADGQAVSAKTSFASLWNAIAGQYGQSTVDQSTI